MADEERKLLFTHRSKYTWISSRLLHTTLLVVLLFGVLTRVQCVGTCQNFRCVRGACENGSCVCDTGWSGLSCDTCGGRARLWGSAGYISDGYGNYSLDTKCSWLIDSGQVNKTIRLRLDHFATECSWDHLYIYDGDSVFSPQIGVYSGILVPEGGAGNKSVPELSARSGRVYLHFYSDAAYNMSGFNISYRMDSCPHDCSGHGYCVEEKCTCDRKWTGEACDIELCPNNCSGHGQCVADRCVCTESYRGDDCSVPPQDGVWYRPSVKTELPRGRASHAAVLDGEIMWIVSGHHFAHQNFKNLAKYHVEKDKWEDVRPVGTESPEARYGHSVVLYNKHLYMFGGLKGREITNELWTFDTVSSQWTRVQTRTNSSAGDAVVGHTAHVIGQIMYVIFGHSPLYGYMNSVQEYDIGANRWSKMETKVKGGYGHSSVYDSRGVIYIHGGYHSASASAYTLSDSLYEFNPATKLMRVLQSSGYYRYLHSAAIIGGLMLVFGGNTHNDTSTSQGALCYSADFLAYDIKCNKWMRLRSPNLPSDVSRFGHTAVTYEKTLKSEMFVFGGFNGRMLNDVIKYQPGECSAYSADKCEQAAPGTRCAKTVQGCTNEVGAVKLKTDKVIKTFSPPACSQQPVSTTDACQALKSCDSCVGAASGCKWCGECVPAQNTCTNQEVLNASACTLSTASRCSLLHNCYACFSDDDCEWDLRSKQCKVRFTRKDKSLCPQPCYKHKSCENCTKNACMWCANQKRCVESNSYVASFPYGQCMEWTTHINKCAATRCSELRTCAECQKHPSCGWCDDQTSTGLGKCMTGGATGPVEEVNGTVIITQQTCPKRRWFFTSCPICQCNGHSTCISGTSTCKRCEHHTTGKQCGICQNGYHGIATNGGNCTPCECNNHADFCDSTTGLCYCRTKGVVGPHCERCDEKYFGNPRGGTCFYELSTDYQFTFNLSKKDDKYYTRINFMNRPTTPDRDLEFSINCSGQAYMNVTVKSNLFEERVLLDNHACRYFKAKFRHSEYKFSPNGNTTFYVYVFDFQTPFMIMITFSQHAELDLPRFFGTFFSCFLSLLLIAAILWKVKQRYDLYRRRQRMFVEMEQMASRPFASVSLDFKGKEESVVNRPQPEMRASKRRKSSKPSPISLEPVNGSKAAVLSLIVQLPRGDEDYTPSTQTGICIGSSLVTLGNPRKTSMEHIKTDKNRRKLQVPVDNCI